MADRRWTLAALLLMLGLAGPALAVKPEQNRGVIIPDAERIYPDVSAGIRATTEGGIWETHLPARQAWQVLKRSLLRLGIGFTETGGEAPRLLTEWVTWGYDAAANTGHSKRPHFGSAGTVERHRFSFEFADDRSGHLTELKIRDAAYQKQVDIAPDSAYSWMEWRDYAPQAGAAFTFGRRLQGDYEAAMSLELVPVSPRSTTGAAAESAANQQTGENAVPSLLVVPPPLLPASPPPAVIPHAAASARSAELPTTTGDRPATVTQTAAGLRVDFPVDAAWDALLQALEDLKVDVATADRNQLMIVTRWVNANYKSKNQQLHFRSNDDSGWAFDWSGSGGLQRHRFQLMLIGAGQGDRTLVRARHTGFQEQIDQTPDSSQTLLAWEDRKLNSGIATAFLHRLRIIDGR